MKGRQIQYSDRELAWIKRNSKKPRAELARKFAKKFDRHDVEVRHISALCRRNRWLVGEAAKTRRKGVLRVFTPAQVTWLKDNANLSRAEVHPAFIERFPGTDITRAQIVGFRKRNGIKTGRSGHFTPGQKSWNKGKKLPVNPNSAKHHFKPGHRPKNRVPLGSERISDGYVEIKVAMPNPHTGASTRFVQKHRYLWERQRGPIPQDHVLKCLSADRTDCDPSNWELVPRGLLPRLNGKCGRNYDAAPDALKPTILAIAKLEHAARNTTSNGRGSDE